MTNAPVVIAEIGCNHKGDPEIAKELIGVAATFSKADYVKFQKRNPAQLLTPEQFAAPHPDPRHSYGETYGEHREALELTMEQHAELMECCQRHKIGYACSVWDIQSAREIAALHPKFIKIPSATNQHFELLGFLCDEYDGAIHVSLGMTTRLEERTLVDFFVERERAKDLVLYACTSGYPVAAEEVCLLEVQRLREEYEDVVHSIGFSGHHLGIALDIAAQALGARWIERHFTLDRTWKGTDHAASLEPDGLRRLVRDVRAVHKGLRHKGAEVLDVEVAQREKLKWRRAR